MLLFHRIFMITISIEINEYEIFLYVVISTALICLKRTDKIFLNVSVFNARFINNFAEIIRFSAI